MTWFDTFSKMRTPVYFILWFTLCCLQTYNHITSKAQQIQWKGFGCVRDALPKCQDYLSDEWDEDEVNIQNHTHLEGSETISINFHFRNECSKELNNKAEESHGVLKKAQIIPLWYFESESDMLASCTGMNVILVWKDIADEQLKKVDLFISAVMGCLEGYGRTDQSITFGVDGENALLSDTLDLQYKQIQIPKIIYRVVRGSWYHDTYCAVIIIHNEPANVSDSDKLCHDNEMLSGWDMIRNNDPRNGLTYVCPLTGELDNKLSIGNSFLADSLNLDAVPYSEHPQWDYTYPITDRDLTSEVNYEFGRFWN